MTPRSLCCWIHQLKVDALENITLLVALVLDGVCLVYHKSKRPNEETKSERLRAFRAVAFRRVSGGTMSCKALKPFRKPRAVGRSIENARVSCVRRQRRENASIIYAVKQKRRKLFWRFSLTPMFWPGFVCELDIMVFFFRWLRVTSPMKSCSGRLWLNCKNTLEYNS